MTYYQTETGYEKAKRKNDQSKHSSLRRHTFWGICIVLVIMYLVGDFGFNQGQTTQYHLEWFSSGTVIMVGILYAATRICASLVETFINPEIYWRYVVLSIGMSMIVFFMFSGILLSIPLGIASLFLSLYI